MLLSRCPQQCGCSADVLVIENVSDNKWYCGLDMTILQANTRKHQQEIDVPFWRKLHLSKLRQEESMEKKSEKETVWKLVYLKEELGNLAYIF